MRRLGVTAPPFCRIAIFTVAIPLSACVPPALKTNTNLGRENVRGTVFDSLTLTPLGGARIAFTRADTINRAVRTITTDSTGAFAVALQTGAWLAAITHARFDSLHVPLPPRRIDVPPLAALTVALATPSPRTVTRAICGAGLRDDDVALMGIVRHATTQKPVESAKVVLKWANLTVTWGGYSRATETQIATTASDGWYVSCGVPAEGTVLAWAERGVATTGAVLATLTKAPGRLDLTLDTTAHRSTGSVDLEPDSNGVSLFPTSVGTGRYRIVVRDLNGRPVSGARARILGRNTARADETGAITLDSIASGTQMLEVLAVGYQPERRTVSVAAGSAPTDTVLLASFKSVLGAVRITAGRDPIGFEVRRNAGRGQFISADDVVRENPANTTRLLRARNDIRYTFDRNGFPRIEMPTGPYTSCRPLVLIDGYPPGPAPTVPGQAVLDWIIHPDEIGGVEIYTTPSQVPREIAKLTIPRPCGAIVFWTREQLGLPKATPRQH